jgi:NDP-sugar pyrophosphorylase family protein
MKSFEALILAAGLGTRLAKLNLNVPKPMAPIGHQPFLEIQLKWLRKCGIKKVIIAINQNGLMIKKYFKSGRWLDMNISYSIEQIPHGTAQTLYKALPLVKSKFFLINGDTAFDFNPLSLAIDSGHSERIIVALVKKNNIARYGSIKLNNQGQITKFLEKDQHGSGYVSTGVLLVNKNILKSVKRHNQLQSLEHDIYPKLVKLGCLYGRLVKGDFWDIGTPFSYKKFKEYYLRKKYDHSKSSTG